MEMLIEEIMTTNVISVSLEDSVKKAATLICLKKFSGIPVVAENEQVIGMLSEKDILRAIFPTYAEIYADPSDFNVFEDLIRRYGSTTHIRVKDIFTKKVITVKPKTSLLKALSLMLSNRIRRLPVIDEVGKLIGIVSQGDIHQALFNQEFLID